MYCSQIVGNVQDLGCHVKLKGLLENWSKYLARQINSDRLTSKAHKLCPEILAGSILGIFYSIKLPTPLLRCLSSSTNKMEVVEGFSPGID